MPSPESIQLVDYPLVGLYRDLCLSMLVKKCATL